MVGDGKDAASLKALDALRAELVPSTLNSLPGVHAEVTGGTAQTQDFTDSMNSHIVYVFAFVLFAAFMLLLVTFRSLVIPLTAILLNLLSVGAAYGVLTAVFQHTWAGEAARLPLQRRGRRVAAAVPVRDPVRALDGLATSQYLELKQMGVGLAVAVLLDATLIRGILLPATMKLLGDWNWWLPRSLGWLPKVRHEGEVAPQPA